MRKDQESLRIRLRKFIRHIFKDDFPVFMVCLIIASMMWIGVMLSREDYSLIKYPVSYIDLPEGKAIASASANYLLLNVELMGKDLIRQRFFRSHEPLLISIKDLPLEKAGAVDLIRIPTVPLIREVEKQLGMANAINGISPDTVYIGLMKRQESNL
ncbi:MAG TPA: hypothetical protein PKH94_01250 [Bacteroidales bacterium]|nr:hypothetical protein [Bacteroidales bacterium]HNS45842.1 hypothetical protein [Bacteroidales bacterium]